MKRCHLIVAASLFALSTGCLSEGNFNEKLAKDFCQKQQECFPDEFDQQYDSVGDCVDEGTAQEDPATECAKAAGCAFDKAGANACRDAVQSSSCDGEDLDFVTACANIYECTDEQQTAFVACISGEGE